MYKKVFLIALAGFQWAYAQQSALTVEMIMRDPVWMGTAPDGLLWDTDGALYFNWNPEAEQTASTFRITPSEHTPKKIDDLESRNLVDRFAYDNNRTRIVFSRDGDLFVRDIRSGKEFRLTNTVQRESNPQFSADGSRIVFQQGDNLFSLSENGGEWAQLTNFTRDGKDNVSQRHRQLTAQNDWLQTDQLDLFDVLAARKERDSIQTARQQARLLDRSLKQIDIGSALLSLQQISPSGRYISYRLTQRPTDNSTTIVPDYVTESGYTEDISARPKVGQRLTSPTAWIYDRQRDTVYEVSTSTLPGVKDLPAFWNDYPEVKQKLLDNPKDRPVTVGQLIWNDAGTDAVVVVTAADNKDRWIMRLDAEKGTLFPIDRQRDEAWIAGPGIGGSWGNGNIGWLDNEMLYFQSEESGYSHLYVANVHGGSKRQLTNGNWEVSNLQLSADRKTFYFTANLKHPGIMHFYRLPVKGGAPIQITTMDGGNEVVLSPDEKWLAVRYSYSNKPWELFLQENKPGAAAVKITESTTAEFNGYPWRDPEVIMFENRHGDEVYARLYRPETPKATRPAVIFVHGAGYLQNVHFWWSQYFREYMFHNLLADLGYTVLDIDYTGSAGYGRDHRTGIYRHMGGKDLSDQVDGAMLLVNEYGVNADNIGIYGGSYGGFITLMAMFNEPDIFAAGAALRSVTDWAHYNHGYTSNILNEPAADPIAYRRSSPIYFADGLKGHLLMCHGMVDVNVHFQDIVRLSQRFIELGKDNWELAVYPVEDHGFVEPSSWTDEYKRILALFEERLAN